jgi:hypothetical protein
VYKSEFQDAVIRTRRLNIECPEIEYYEGQFLTRERMERFPYILRDLVGEIDVREVVAQCLSIHFRLSEIISRIFETPCYFTIGYVETPEQLMFHQSEEDLEKLLKNGISGNSLSIHAWLTLPTMEILDFSLPTSFAIMHENEEEIGGLIATHADSLTGGLKYHPMLVGEDFLRKSGGLIEFSN